MLESMRFTVPDILNAWIYVLCACVVNFSCWFYHHGNIFMRRMVLSFAVNRLLACSALAIQNELRLFFSLPPQTIRLMPFYPVQWSSFGAEIGDIFKIEFKHKSNECFYYTIIMTFLHDTWWQNDGSFPTVSRTITSIHFINWYHTRESIDIHRLMNAISMKYFRTFIEKLSWLKTET